LTKRRWRPTIFVMATKTHVVVTDDLDGSSDAETVCFGYRGSSYEIDLSPKNAARLEKAMAPYIAVARRVPGQRRRPAISAAGRARGDRAAVRAWAREQGLKVSERGRISADVVARYEAVQY
jgi:Lsr2